MAFALNPGSRGRHFSQAIDWQAPWLAPWRALGQPVATEAARLGDLPAALNRVARGVPRTFVPQADLPPGVAYESHIFATASVPTREGLHDFFNALCWLRFPQTKAWLNQAQAQAIAAAGGVAGPRGALRDALTLFDENVALWQAPVGLWQALLARDWQALFVTLRAQWADATLVLFGHALTEKLVQPYKSITAHVLCLPVPNDIPASSDATVHPWDAWLVAQLPRLAWAAKPYTPLPVLGHPAWWPDNQDPGFYADAQVFRPLRARVTHRP